MKSFLIIAITILLLLSNVNAQTVAPLKLGNIWVYDNISRLSRITVIDTSVYFDTIAYCKLYYEVNDGALQFYTYARLREDNFYVLFNEIDSTEGAGYYKKNAVIGDTWTAGTLVCTIEDTFVANVFGEQTTIKYLTKDDGLVYVQEYWTEKFGELGSQDFGGVIDDLKGCVIDGIVYGDTSFIPVSVEDEFTLNEFVLSQNFPNPFNPSTSINFTLPEGDFISLEVFDVLGEKVKTLINEFKTAGTHTIQFEADVLASGIYLYVLRTTNFTKTKKMQLMR
jgi:hypothetical protein